MELYFVPKMTKPGCNNPFGSVVRYDAGARVVAHELGHACNWIDLYVERTNSLERVRGAPHVTRTPDDWNNGTGSRFYDPDSHCQETLVRRLLMYGLGNHGIDIPLGRIEALILDGATYRVLTVENGFRTSFRKPHHL